MKIAILTSGVLPVPAVQGGAVENLVDIYLDYNERHQLHDITVYSIWHPSVSSSPAGALAGKTSTQYVFIHGNSLKAKLWKAAGRLLRRKGYYHDSIEYYLHEAMRQINKERYDLIVVENRPGYALTLSRHCAVPCVLHLHNDFLYPGAYRAEEICHTFQRIISVSDYITGRVRSVCREKEKCFTVHNAINLTAFQETTPVSRQTLGLADEDFVLVFSGRLIEEKGILQLIQAISQLRHIPRLKLLIIGANAYGKGQSPTPFTMQLQREAEALEGRIVFTGFVDYKDVPSYLKAADVAVLPSMWDEPFGLTVLEAMAAGLPLITTRSGGIPEICEGVATIVDRDDVVKHLATAILDLYEHPEKRKEMSQAALNRSAAFDKDNYARQFWEKVV